MANPLTVESVRTLVLHLQSFHHNADQLLIFVDGLKIESANLVEELETTVGQMLSGDVEALDTRSLINKVGTFLSSKAVAKKRMLDLDELSDRAINELLYLIAERGKDA